MVDPNDMVVHGWDISGLNLYEACKRAHVLEPDLINQLKDDLSQIVPLPAAFNGEFIAANQADRADNIKKGNNLEIVQQIRQDIQNMKKQVDKVVILWTANTEQYLLPEIETVDELIARLHQDAQLPASVLYCVAAIEEQVLYLNGSP